MKYSALLKYALFENEAVEIRTDLFRVSPADCELLRGPFLWRIHLHLPFHNVLLVPAEVTGLVCQESTLGTFTCACVLIGNKEDWPLKDSRLNHQRAVVELEQIQRSLFHGEQREEPLAQFINERMSRRKN